MKKSIFVCHRPYHILRSCDFIKRDMEKGYNILIVLDVKAAGNGNYERFNTNQIFYSYFDEVIELPREDAPIRRHFFPYVKFCQKKRLEYKKIVDKHSDVDEMYFFCDNEPEIQLLVGLFAEKMKPTGRRVLIDEGMVTYNPKEHIYSKRTILYSKIISKVAGLKYYNLPDYYGGSNLYNYSYANCPERAYFQKPIDKMPLLQDEVCGYFRSKLKEALSLKLDKPYFLYIGTYEKSLEVEVPILKEIKSILEKHNVELYIKLHPQQNEELYKPIFPDVYFINKAYPVELFLSKYSIMGGTISSSLYNAVLQGNHAMLLSPLFGLDVQSYFKWVEIDAINDFESFENHIISIINKY